MDSPVSQFSTSYIGKQNRETACGIMLLFAMFANKLYNVGVHTTGKHAESVFISAIKGGVVSESCFRQSGRVNSHAALFDWR